MSPKADDFDSFFLVEHLVNQTVLQIDSSGIKTLKVTNQFLIRRRSLIRIFTNDINEGFSFRIKMSSFQPGNILCSNFSIYNFVHLPVHLLLRDRFG